MKTTLSPNEKKVLDLLCSGKRIKQIAADLELHYNTVTTLLHRAMRKFGVKSVHQMIFLYARSEDCSVDPRAFTIEHTPEIQL